MGEARTAAVSALLTGSAHFGHGTIATIVGITPLVIGATATAVLGELQRDLDRMAEWEVLLYMVDLALGLTIASALFAMIYKILPSQSIAWGDVWIGALVTAALFTVGKILIGVYLSKSAFTSGYGAAGSLLVLLLWIYYSAQIFLLGAEFTREFTYAHGSRRNTRLITAAQCSSTRR